MLRWMLAAALIALPGAALAQHMTVDQFLVKAYVLKGKGVFALWSSDLPPVKAEIKSIATSYRADLRADRAAGRPPPEGSDAAKIKPAAFLADLERIPVAQRSMSMKTAFYQIMKRRWPC